MCKKWLILAVIGCLLLAVGCDTVTPATPSSPTTSTTEQPPTGVVGGTTPTLCWDPSDSTDPYAAKTRTGRQLCTLLHDGLTTVGSDWSVSPLWAETVTQTDPTHLEVTLRADAVFADGKPMTAEHVITSWGDAKKSDAYGALVANILSLKATDRTLTVTLVAADTVNPTASLAFPIVRREKKTVVGCGRYVIDSKAGTLSVNPHHPDQPSIQSWKLYAVESAEDLPYALASGRVSLYTTDLHDGVMPSVAGDVRQETAVLPQLLYVGVNSNGGALKEALFRQALSLAVNRQVLCTDSFGGYAKATANPFLNGNNGEIGLLQENIAQAVAKWKELGYNDRQSGVPSSANAKALPELELLTLKEQPFHRAAAKRLCEQWQAVGLTVKEIPLSSAEYRARIRAGNFELYLGEIRLSEDCSLRPWLSESGNAAVALPDGATADYAAYLAGEMTAEEYRQTFADTLPFIPLCWRMGAAVCGNSLSGLSLGGPSFYSGIVHWKWS